MVSSVIVQKKVVELATSYPKAQDWGWGQGESWVMEG